MTMSSISVSDITDTSATFTWSTSESACSQVDCGILGPEGIRSPLDLTLVLNHSQTLNFLAPNTTYFCRAKSMDAKGNLAWSEPLGFNTTVGAKPKSP